MTTRGIVDAIGQTTIRVMLRRHKLKPWRKKMWCVGEIDDEYIRRMEDLLDLYEKEPDPNEPVICLDEKSIPLTADVRPPRAMAPGKLLRPDDEYTRQGVANAFYMVQPKAGKHVIKITETRTAGEFEEMMRDVGRAYPRADKIHLVLDNLNTHCEKSVVEHLAPFAARTFGTDLRCVSAHTWKLAEPSRNRPQSFHPRVPWQWQAPHRRSCRSESPVIRLAGGCNAARRTIKWTFTKREAQEKFGYSRLTSDRVEG